MVERQSCQGRYLYVPLSVYIRGGREHRESYSYRRQAQWPRQVRFEAQRGICQVFFPQAPRGTAGVVNHHGSVKVTAVPTETSREVKMRGLPSCRGTRTTFPVARHVDKIRSTVRIWNPVASAICSRGLPFAFMMTTSCF